MAQVENAEALAEPMPQEGQQEDAAEDAKADQTRICNDEEAKAVVATFTPGEVMQFTEGLLNNDEVPSEVIHSVVAQVLATREEQQNVESAAEEKVDEIDIKDWILNAEEMRERALELLKATSLKANKPIEDAEFICGGRGSRYAWVFTHASTSIQAEIKEQTDLPGRAAAQAQIAVDRVLQNLPYEKAEKPVKLASAYLRDV